MQHKPLLTLEESYKCKIGSKNREGNSSTATSSKHAEVRRRVCQIFAMILLIY